MPRGFCRKASQMTNVSRIWFLNRKNDEYLGHSALQFPQLFSNSGELLRSVNGRTCHFKLSEYPCCGAHGSHCCGLLSEYFSGDLLHSGVPLKRFEECAASVKVCCADQAENNQGVRLKSQSPQNLYKLSDLRILFFTLASWLIGGVLSCCWFWVRGQATALEEVP